MSFVSGGPTRAAAASFRRRLALILRCHTSPLPSQLPPDALTRSGIADASFVFPMIGEVDSAKLAAIFDKMLPRLADLEAGRASGADLLSELLNELGTAENTDDKSANGARRSSHSGAGRPCLRCAIPCAFIRSNDGC